MANPWPPPTCQHCGANDPSEGGRVCGAHKTNGTRRAKSNPKPHCQKPPGHGVPDVTTGRCSLHGGAAPQAIDAHQRRMEAKAAVDAVTVFGLPVDIEPQDALLLELSRSAGHCAWLQQLIASFEDKSELKQLTKDSEDRMWEKPSVWVELYERERRHFTDVAKACVVAGLMERRVRLEEMQMELLAQAMRGAMNDPALGLTGEQRAAFPKVIRRHLALVHSVDDRGHVPEVA